MTQNRNLHDSVRFTRADDESDTLLPFFPSSCATTSLCFLSLPLYYRFHRFSLFISFILFLFPSSLCSSRSLFLSFLPPFFISLLSFPPFDLKSRELRHEVCGPFSYATVSVPFPLSLSLATFAISVAPRSCLYWFLSSTFSLPLPIISLSLFLSPSPSLPLYISRYYCIPTARISEMKSTLLLALPSSVLRPFPPPAAAKSLAGLLRRQKFNIAVTLRWLYVLTVSPLCSDNVLLSKSDSAERRPSGRVDSPSWRIHESGE